MSTQTTARYAHAANGTTTRLSVTVSLAALLTAALAGGALGATPATVLRHDLRRERITVQSLREGRLGYFGADRQYRTDPVGQYLRVRLRHDPEATASVSHIGDSVVDEQAAVLLRYAAGQIAICYTAARTNTPHLAFIMGTDAQMWLGDSWWNGRALEIRRPGADAPEIIEPERKGNGYNYEAEEVGRCLREGLPESPVMGLDESLSIVQTMDQIRAQWGLRYPMEQEV